MDRSRVLVVEDRPSVLTLMATILETGYDVATAADGTAALALLGSASFDVVLTDVRVPGASGFHLLRELQERANAPAVVLMTAYANVADAVEAMRLGAYDYVAKPLDKEEVLLVVARAVEHVTARRALGFAGAPDETGAFRAGEQTGVAVGFHRAVQEARDRASRWYLTRLMREYGGNVTRAAKRAGMTRESLHRVLKKHCVRADDVTPRSDPTPAVARTGSGRAE